MSKKHYIAIGAILTLLLVGILVFCLIHMPGETPAEPSDPATVTTKPTEPPTDPPTNPPTTPPTNPPTEPPTEPPTQPPTTPPTEPPAEPVLWRGVVASTTLNIRATPGGKQIDGYNQGKQVAILEEKTVNGVLWGRTDRGWISLEYIKPIVPRTSSGGYCHTDIPEELHDMPAEYFTVSGDKKTYNGGSLQVTIPADWLTLEQHFEDNGVSYFRHPTINCQFRFEPSESIYIRKPTEEEYRDMFFHSNLQDLKFLSITQEKISGFSCNKVVYSYTTSEGVQRTAILYDNIVIGVIMYRFYIYYPAAESEQLAPVFDAITDSIVLLPYSPIRS